MEALADGQIRPSRWWKLDSYHCDFRGFNLLGRLYLKVALRAVSGLRPTRLPGLSNPYNSLFQYYHRHNETAHVTADPTAARAAAPAPVAADPAPGSSDTPQHGVLLINFSGSHQVAE